MKSMLIISFIITSCLGANKINLEDIARDSSGLLKSTVKDNYSDRYQGGLGSYSTIPSKRYQEYRADAEDHSQQIRVIPKIFPQSAYEMPSIAVKYSTTTPKGIVYIPMSEFLAYYPELSAGHHLAMQNQRIPVRVYKAALNQVTFTNIPSKMNFETSYGGKQPKKSQQTDVLFPAKTNLPGAQTEYIENIPASSPYEPSTYTSIPVYINGPVVTHAYKQMKDIHSQSDEAKRHQYTLSSSKPVYPTQDEKHQSQKLSSYIEENLEFQPHNVHGAIHQYYTQNHLEHKSLLDSYIPSGIIAAQDTERYRERPLKLEGGFLPSKINFKFI